jgi:hypothetical protein
VGISGLDGSNPYQCGTLATLSTKSQALLDRYALCKDYLATISFITGMSCRAMVEYPLLDEPRPPEKIGVEEQLFSRCFKSSMLSLRCFAGSLASILVDLLNIRFSGSMPVE